MHTNIDTLYDYFLKQFTVSIDNKTIKHGKLRLILNKEYFIVFTYSDLNDKIKTIEFPHPFDIVHHDNIFEFDYRVDTLCNSTNFYNDVKAALLSLNINNKHAFYNKVVTIKFTDDESSKLFS